VGGFVTQGGLFVKKNREKPKKQIKTQEMGSPYNGFYLFFWFLPVFQKQSPHEQKLIAPSL